MSYVTFELVSLIGFTHIRPQSASVVLPSDSDLPYGRVVIRLYPWSTYNRENTVAVGFSTIRASGSHQSLRMFSPTVKDCCT